MESVALCDATVDLYGCPATGVCTDPYSVLRTPYVQITDYGYSESATDDTPTRQDHRMNPPANKNVSIRGDFTGYKANRLKTTPLKMITLPLRP